MVNLIWWNKNWGFELISVSFNKHFSDHLPLLRALLAWASCFFGILNKGATAVNRKGDQEHRRDIKGSVPNLQLINDKVWCYRGSESVAGMPHTKWSDRKRDGWWVTRWSHLGLWVPLGCSHPFFAICCASWQNWGQSSRVLPDRIPSKPTVI